MATIYAGSSPEWVGTPPALGPFQCQLQPQLEEVVFISFFVTEIIRCEIAKLNSLLSQNRGNGRATKGIVGYCRDPQQGSTTKDKATQVAVS